MPRNAAAPCRIEELNSINDRFGDFIDLWSFHFLELYIVDPGNSTVALALDSSEAPAFSGLVTMHTE